MYTLQLQVFRHCAQRPTAHKIDSDGVDSGTHKRTLDSTDSNLAAPSKKTKGNNNSTIAKSGTVLKDGTQAPKELFSWTDVLHSVDSNAEKAARRHSKLVEVLTC